MSKQGTPLDRPCPFALLPADVDECKEYGDAICGTWRCQNSLGSYRCIMGCQPGFHWTPLGDCIGEYSMPGPVPSLQGQGSCGTSLPGARGRRRRRRKHVASGEADNAESLFSWPSCLLVSRLLSSWHLEQTLHCAAFRSGRVLGRLQPSQAWGWTTAPSKLCLLEWLPAPVTCMAALGEGKAAISGVRQAWVWSSGFSNRRKEKCEAGSAVFLVPHTKRLP